MQHSVTDTLKTHDKRNAHNAYYIPQIPSSLIPHTHVLNIPDITCHSGFVTGHSNTRLNTPQTIESIVIAMERALQERTIKHHSQEKQRGRHNLGG